MTARYTTDELIALSKDEGPFALGNLRQAIVWAAQTVKAADAAVKAEYARAESLKPQPVKQALIALVAEWNHRCKTALPADAMLINKHIRELREAIEGVKP